MAEILPFFAVPFGFAKLDNCAPLNQELRELFLARSAEGGEHANPRPLTQRNPQVFESNFGLFRSTERCLQQLKEFCWRHLIKCVCDLNGYDDAMRSRLLHLLGRVVPRHAPRRLLRPAQSSERIVVRRVLRRSRPARQRRC